REGRRGRRRFGAPGLRPRAHRALPRDQGEGRSRGSAAGQPVPADLRGAAAAGAAGGGGAGGAPRRRGSPGGAEPSREGAPKGSGRGMNRGGSNRGGGEDLQGETSRAA